MSSRCLWPFLLFAAVLGCGQSGLMPSPVTDVPEFLRPVAEASKVTLLSVDGSWEEQPNLADGFHGYPVLGRMPIDTPQLRDEILSAFVKSTVNQGNSLLCFNQRHGLRVESKGRVVDYLICFECHLAFVYEGSKTDEFRIDREPARKMLNDLFDQHGVKKAPAPKTWGK